MRGSMTAGVCAAADGDNRAMARIAKPARMEKDRDMMCTHGPDVAGVEPP